MNRPLRPLRNEIESTDIDGQLVHPLDIENSDAFFTNLVRDELENYLVEEIQQLDNLTAATNVFNKMVDEFINYAVTTYLGHVETDSIVVVKEENRILQVIEEYREADTKLGANELIHNNLDIFNYTGDLLRGLGIPNLGLAIKAKRIKIMIREQTQMQLEKIGGLKYLNAQAIERGRQGGQNKALKQKEVVFFASREYENNYMNSKHSQALAAKMINDKTNEHIQNTPELRAQLQLFSETFEAVLKWISNFSSYMKTKFGRQKPHLRLKSIMSRGNKSLYGFGINAVSPSL